MAPMNSTLTEGLRILELLASSAQPHALGELAQRLDLPKSRVHRLLQTWRDAGYVEQDEDRRYRIGLAPLALSHAWLARNPLRQAALPILHEGSQATGLDWVLVLRHRDAVLVAAGIYPDGRRLDAASSLGARLSLHASASGKCLLAWLDDAERARLLAAHPPQPITPRTLTTREALDADAALVRRRGWAWNDSENGEGVGSLAVALDASAPTAFLGLSGPRAVVAARVEDLSRQLLSLRDRLIAQLAPTAIA
jgi:IclR family transcriptional regulator, KDG regulon repressor